MAQVDMTFKPGTRVAMTKPLMAQCFSVVGRIIYGKEPEPKDVSVFDRTPRASLTPYWLEIKVLLDSEDWITDKKKKVMKGKAGREAYDAKAEAILSEMAPSISLGLPFFVWVRGRVDGFAEGVGTLIRQDTAGS